MARSSDMSNPLELKFGALLGNHNHPSQQDHRSWPRIITNTCRTSTAAPSHLGGGNHQEKQESRSKSTTKCQLDAISQYKCTWITQSYLEYTKKQERGVEGELFSSKCSQVCQRVQEREPWASQRVFIDVPLRIELLGTRFSSSRTDRTRWSHRPDARSSTGRAGPVTDRTRWSSRAALQWVSDRMRC
jgi:hypothetical protein